MRKIFKKSIPKSLKRKSIRRNRKSLKRKSIRRSHKSLKRKSIRRSRKSLKRKSLAKYNNRRIIKKVTDGGKDNIYEHIKKELLNLYGKNGDDLFKFKYVHLDTGDHATDHAKENHYDGCVLNPDQITRLYKQLQEKMKGMITEKESTRKKGRETFKQKIWDLEKVAKKDFSIIIDEKEIFYDIFIDEKDISRMLVKIKNEDIKLKETNIVLSQIKSVNFDNRINEVDLKIVKRRGRIIDSTIITDTKLPEESDLTQYINIKGSTCYAVNKNNIIEEAEQPKHIVGMSFSQYLTFVYGDSEHDKNKCFDRVLKELKIFYDDSICKYTAMTVSHELSGDESFDKFVNEIKLVIEVLNKEKIEYDNSLKKLSEKGSELKGDMDMDVASKKESSELKITACQQFKKSTDKLKNIFIENLEFSRKFFYKYFIGKVIIDFGKGIKKGDEKGDEKGDDSISLKKLFNEENIQLALKESEEAEKKKK